jgi:glycosyltransferase involved in cell wall biosynthesis
MVKPRTLLAIGIQPRSTLLAEIAAGQQPRRDYYMLQQALDADLIFPADAWTTFFGRLITRFLGATTAVAWLAFRRRHAYDNIYSDTESVGLPLALFLKLSGTRPGHPRHTLVSQGPEPLKKRIFFRLGVGSHLDTIIVHAESLRTFALSVLHMPGERVLKLPGVMDEKFWQPPASPTAAVGVTVGPAAKQRPIICASGLEFRDYPTLLAAVRGLDVDVHIAAASAHALHKASRSQLYRRTPSSQGSVPAAKSLPEVPPNVYVKSYDYTGMRQLYAVSSFVVLPLRENNEASGSSVVLEAMAMGKAVIVSGTRGQTDIIRDPRNDGRGLVVREWWPGFLEDAGLTETLGQLPTGFYVTPGDSDELREMIQYLLDHPEVAEELGRNGRRIIEAYFGMDGFVRRYAAAICGEPQPAYCST